MKGFVSASSVRINQEGWTIIKDFKFFRNLYRKSEGSRHYNHIICNFITYDDDTAVLEFCIFTKKKKKNPPPVNLLITFSEPANRWHLFPRGCPIQIHNHIVLSDQKLQRANDIPAGHGKLLLALVLKCCLKNNRRTPNKHLLE